MCQVCFDEHWEGRDPAAVMLFDAETVARVKTIVFYYRGRPQGWGEWAGDCLHLALDDDNYDQDCTSKRRYSDFTCEHPEICKLWADLDVDARSLVVADLRGYSLEKRGSK